MKKRKSRAIGKELEAGTDCIHGLHELETTLGIVATTETMMTGLVANAYETNADFQSALSVRLAATVVLRREFKKAGTFIMVVRDNLKPLLGTRYSEKWNPVGFYSGSLKVPMPMKHRACLLRDIEAFFALRPELEIPGVMTRAMAAALSASFHAAMAASRDAKIAQRQEKKVRNAALAKLRVRIQTLRAELKPLLAPNDPRWLKFGFGVPTDVHVPAAPEGVILTQEAVTGRVKASWNQTAHTDRFRVYLRMIGTDAEPVLRDTTTETSFDFGTFATGTHLEVQVAAINSAGESVASQAVEIEVT